MTFDPTRLVTIGNIRLCEPEPADHMERMREVAAIAAKMKRAPRMEKLMVREFAAFDGLPKLVVEESLGRFFGGLANGLHVVEHFAVPAGDAWLKWSDGRIHHFKIPGEWSAKAKPLSGRNRRRTEMRQALLKRAQRKRVRHWTTNATMRKEREWALRATRTATFYRLFWNDEPVADFVPRVL